jgi:predicted nucleic acid-binding protein
MIYALDTNIVSYCLKGDKNIKTRIFTLLSRESNSVIIPPFTFFESLRGLLAIKASRKLNDFIIMYEQLDQGQMEQGDWIQAAELYAEGRQTGHPMEDGDLLQAAYCIRRGYILVTHNTKHFFHVRNLPVEDWTLPAD